MAQAAKTGFGLRLWGPQDWFEVAHICVCGFGLRQFLVRREDKRTTNSNEVWDEMKKWMQCQQT